MAVEAFQYNGRTYGVGLSWEGVDDLRKWRDESDAKRPAGYDLVSLWRAAASQYQLGFAKSSDQLGAQDLALAPMLSLALGHDWAGIFEIAPETFDVGARYAFIAVADTGVIMRDVAGDEAEARAAWREYKADLEAFNAKVGRLFAPAEFKLDGAEFVVLERLVVTAGYGQLPLVGRFPALARLRFLDALVLGGARLAPIGAAPSVVSRATRKNGSKGAARGLSRDVMIIASAVVLVGGVIGKTVYERHQQDLIDRAEAKKIEDARIKREQEAKEAQRLAQEAAASAAKAGPVMPNGPWLSSPSVADFMQRCSEEMGLLKLSLKGWTLSSATCMQSDMTAVYDRNGVATTDDVVNASMAAYGVKPEISKLTGVNASITLRYASAAVGDEDLASLGKNFFAVHSHFQALGSAVAFDAVDDSFLAPRVDGKPVDLPWDHYHFLLTTPVTAISTKRFPSQLLGGLDIPGLRVTAITVKRTDAPPFNTWTIEGALYVPHGS